MAAWYLVMHNLQLGVLDSGNDSNVSESSREEVLTCRLGWYIDDVYVLFLSIDDTELE